MNDEREKPCLHLPDRQVAALAPDALAPAQVEAKAEALAASKAALANSRCFVLAMFAGAFVSMGAAFFGLVTSDATLPFVAQRVLGGLCFCLGLQLVLCCGAELFTGNMLMVCGAMGGTVRWPAVFKNWVLVWVGNCAGVLLAVLLLYLGNLQDMNDGAVGDSFVSLAAGKAALDAPTVFFKGVMCNVLVCLAVWIGFSARTVADKVLGILLPIMAFVAMGFEHCVANMFFFSMGIACRAAGFGADVAAVEGLTVGGAAFNLLFSTLGNVVGGALLIGLGYWFVYRKNGDPAEAALGASGGGAAK